MSERAITGHENFGLKRVDCGTCNALCCRRGTRMRMSPGEVDFMGGKDHLQEIEPPHRRRIPLLPRVNGVYRLPQDCAHLTESPVGGAPICDSHEDPNRPKACAAFEPGTFACRAIRAEAGIDSLADFAAYVALTGQDMPGADQPPIVPSTPPMAA